MIGEDINIKQKLEEEKTRNTKGQGAFLDAVGSLLGDEYKVEMKINKDLQTESCNIQNIQLDKLDKESIYTLE